MHASCMSVTWCFDKNRVNLIKLYIASGILKGKNVNTKIIYQKITK